MNGACIWAVDHALTWPGQNLAWQAGWAVVGCLTGPMQSCQPGTGRVESACICRPFTDGEEQDWQLEAFVLVLKTGWTCMGRTVLGLAPPLPSTTKSVAHH